MLTTCRNCCQTLVILRHDRFEGSKTFEEVYCPLCDAYLCDVASSGFPTAHLVKGTSEHAVIYL